MFGEFGAGFVADKLGIYKPIIITAGFIMGFIQLPILWLESAHKIHVAERNETVQLAGNATLAPSSNAAVPRDYIFPILLMIRIFGFIFMDAALTLLDAAGLAMTKKHQGDFAKQKTAGFLSMIFIPILCGLLIDAISDKLGTPIAQFCAILRRRIRLIWQFICRLQRLLNCVLHWRRTYRDSYADTVQNGSRSSNEQAIHHFNSQKSCRDDRRWRFPSCRNLRGFLWVEPFFFSLH